MTKHTISQTEANNLYTRGNNAGLGYAPYADVAGPDTVSAAVAAAEADGWEIVLNPDNTSDVVVLTNGDGELLGIGGDGAGNGAWAVVLSDDLVTVEEMPDEHRASHKAAGNWGSYPHNGATRRQVTRDEADAIVENDPDQYARIV